MLHSINGSFEKIIQDVLSKISLCELIGEEVILQKKGAEFWGLCPFHHEKTASFSVSDRKNFYHCFGCGAHGNAIDYVMQKHNRPFKEALEFLAEKAGIRLPTFSTLGARDNKQKQDKKQNLITIHKLMLDYCHAFLKTNPKAEKARQYLEKRKISLKVIEDFKLGYCDGSIVQYLMNLNYSQSQLEEAGIAVLKDNTLKDRFINRIIFPIFDVQDHVVAFGGRIFHEAPSYIPKYLNSNETPIFHKGNHLYNLNRALTFSREHPIILVEGYMDVLSMSMYGFPQTVASLGTALTEQQIETIWKYSDQPILCFDGDIAGIRASIRAVKRALPLLKPGKTLFFCYLPEGLDPDDFLKEKGAEAMKQHLKISQPLVDVLWKDLISTYEIKNLNRDYWIPEDRSALKRDILKVVSLISHQDIQSSYRQLLMDRFFQKRYMLTPLDKTLKKNFLQPRTHFNSQNIVGQKILLGILLKNPILLLDVDELLSRVNFLDPLLLEIKEWLLNQYFSGIDYENVLFCNQRDIFLKKIGLETLKTHASFLFNTQITKDEILKRWKEIWFCAVGYDMVRGDLRRICQDFKKNFSERAWLQIKALFFDASRSDQDIIN